jgi:nicotinate-nucleotide adenylyltransferase
MIGIYGGTFDPVHFGHLRTALEVKEQFGLREIRLLLAAQPPLRQQPAASAQHRLQMLQHAVAGYSGMIVDKRELDRGGPSYMVDTLAAIRKDDHAQQVPVLLVIGTDAFKQLTNWHQWQCLFDYAHVVVMTRPGYTTGKLGEFFVNRLTNSKQQLYDNLFGKLYFQVVTQLDISATRIREIITLKQNPDFLLPDEVITYIRKHKLYQYEGIIE